MKATVSTPTDREIRIERVFNAPRERVWQAFTGSIGPKGRLAVP